MKIRKKDLSAMSKAALVEMAWEIYRNAEQARSIYGGGEYCVITPDEIFQVLDERSRPLR